MGLSRYIGIMKHVVFVLYSRPPNFPVILLDYLLIYSIKTLSVDLFVYYLPIFFLLNDMNHPAIRSFKKLSLPKCIEFNIMIYQVDLIMQPFSEKSIKE